MKTLFKSISILVIGMSILACQQEEITPNTPTPTPPVVIDTTGTGGNTVDSTLIKFVVRTTIPSEYLDSVVITQLIAGNPIDTLVILPNDIVDLGTYVRFNALQISSINTMKEVNNEQFVLRVYFNSPSSYNDSDNRFEFGYNTNSETASVMFSLTQNSGTGNKYKHGVQ